MASMTISAILADLIEYYKEYNKPAIQMVLTIPPLFGVIFAIAAGPASKVIGDIAFTSFKILKGREYTMTFRRAKTSDISTIYNIIKQAQEYMKDNGINQWQDNYPNEDIIIQDVKQEINYVYCDGDKVIGTIVVLFDGEPDYDKIYDGSWINNNEYVVIHKIAVDESVKGLGIAAKMISNVEKRSKDKGFKSIRVDTHKDNISMQRMLNKSGFKYCGLIYLKSGDERIAFEKIL